MPKHVPNIDSVYYRDGVNDTLSMRLLKRARTAMFRLFMQEMLPNPQTRIVDIGTSDEENEGANFLEKNYPWRHNVTCAGIGDGAAIRRAYPDVSFRQIEPGQKLPFDDASFDIAYSNAVIEHVGGVEERQAFIAEHLRVAPRAFIAFPNRWFPVEHHTGIPFLHYNPRLFRSFLAGTARDYWAKREHLDFLSARLIGREWPKNLPAPSRLVMTGLPLGPFSSNVAIIVP